MLEGRFTSKFLGIDVLLGFALVVVTILVMHCVRAPDGFKSTMSASSFLKIVYRVPCAPFCFSFIVILIAFFFILIDHFYNYYVFIRLSMYL